MYCHHFGFHQPPFKITPDPALFFPGGNRGAVLDALIYAIGRGEGIVKVVGEVGSGKTMLCRMLEREIPDNCEVIYLANPNLSPEEILPAIAYELKLAIPLGATKPMVMHQLHDYLLAKHADNRRVVMFVEEAQGMPLATLEEIRLLSNLETAQDKLLQNRAVRPARTRCQARPARDSPAQRTHHVSLSAGAVHAPRNPRLPERAAACVRLSRSGTVHTWRDPRTHAALAGPAAPNQRAGRQGLARSVFERRRARAAGSRRARGRRQRIHGGPARLRRSSLVGVVDCLPYRRHGLRLAVAAAGRTGDRSGRPPAVVPAPGSTLARGPRRPCAIPISPACRSPR